MTTLTAPSTVTGTYAIDAAHSSVGFVARHAALVAARLQRREVSRRQLEDPAR